MEMGFASGTKVVGVRKIDLRFRMLTVTRLMSLKMGLVRNNETLKR